jgi:tellurite resistance protein TehA-like permease
VTILAETPAQPAEPTEPTEPTDPALPVPARRVGPAGRVSITPNWYAAVMGTGIVATAGVTLRDQLPAQHVAATVVWLLAAGLLLALSLTSLLGWRRGRTSAAPHHRDPVMVHFYGAPPMALMTVGAGTLLLGKDLVGLPVAVAADWLLWSAGTVLGLATAVVVPYLTFTRAASGIAPGPAFGGWLMPVVPPMVSAATGALLLPHTPAGQPRLTLLLACYAMFGLSLLASLVVIALVWAQLARPAAGPVVLTPTLFIVLGPLGQSVTAANLLGANAHLALPAPYSTGLQVFGLVYGVPVIGFALLWASIAVAMTVRAARGGLPFALTWWAFTFPVGTCVTGLTGLANHTGSAAMSGAASAAYVALVLAWVTVATRTVRGVAAGRLLTRVSG